MAFSMADGTITTGDEIAHFISVSGQGVSAYGDGEWQAETCDLPAAPLSMPAQPIEPESGPLRRLWKRLRPNGRDSASVDVGA